MKYVRILIAAAIYFCVATVIAQAVLLGMLWFKGLVSEEKMWQMLALAHGIELPGSHQREDAERAVHDEQQPYEQVLESRFRASLDLDLRETALDKARLDLRNLQSHLQTERQRYDDLRTAFDTRLAELQQESMNTALQELRLTLEALRPEQAKDQILKILEDTSGPSGDDPMRDVVTIVKGMLPDKRKKILAAFATEAEKEKLADILQHIRLGAGEAELIKQARQELDRFSP